MRKFLFYCLLFLGTITISNCSSSRDDESVNNVSSIKDSEVEIMYDLPYGFGGKYLAIDSNQQIEEFQLYISSGAKAKLVIKNATNYQYFRGYKLIKNHPSNTVYLGWGMDTYSTVKLEKITSDGMQIKVTVVNYEGKTYSAKMKYVGYAD